MVSETQRDAASELAAVASRNDSPLADLISMRMVVLFTLMRRSTNLIQRREFQLSEIEWRIMTQLDEHRRLSLNGMAERLVQDRGQLSRAVKGMVERGLLTRTRKPGGPEVEIALAPAGLVLYEKMVIHAIERDEFLTQGLDPSEVAVVREVMNKMIVRAEALIERALEQARD